jgi:hypothetical protein
MTDNLQKKAAVILAVTDRIVYGAGAKPSGYWGVQPMEKAHELDNAMKGLTPEELEVVLDRLTGEVA